MNARMLIATSLLLTALYASSAPAGIVRVGPLPAFPTIQQAVDYAVAHPGLNDIRVHTGVYNESFTVPTTLNSGQMLISGGWDDSYITQLPDGALNTIVSPGPNQRCALLQPSGGTLGISDLHFRDGNVADLGGGLLVQSTAGATVTLFHNIIEQNLVSATNNYVRGAGVAVTAIGTGAVNVLGNRFDLNRAEVVSGSGAVFGASLYVQCTGQTTCVLADNLITGTSAQARNAMVTGGAAYLDLKSGATGQFDRNRIAGVALDPGLTGADGVSLALFAYDTTTMLVRGNRLEAGSNNAVSNTNELFVSSRSAASATLSDNLLARSAASLGAYMKAEESSKLYLTNMTFADVGQLVFGSTSSTPLYLSNSLFSGTTKVLSNVVESSNAIVPATSFLAPALYDYSLRRLDPLVSDAGNDAPQGGLGAIDISGGARVRGPHVDIGAWESSDRIYADRFDN